MAVSGLKAADETGRRWRQEHALLRHGIGAGAETAGAISGMAAKIEPGPIVQRAGDRRLGGRLSREHRALRDQRAKREAGNRPAHPQTDQRPLRPIAGRRLESVDGWRHDPNARVTNYLNY